jgi:hypothetical protein
MVSNFNYQKSESGLVYNLYPQTSAGPVTQEVVTSQDLLDSAEEEAHTEMKSFINTFKTENDYLKDVNIDTMVSEVSYKNEPEILFMGTMSMKPTQYRGASGIYLNIPGDSDEGYGIIMDCAEGSYGQLLDHYQSEERVNKILQNLRVIFITHLHADHHLGTIKMLHQRDGVLASLFTKE